VVPKVYEERYKVYQERYAGNLPFIYFPGKGQDLSFIAFLFGDEKAVQIMSWCLSLCGPFFCSLVTYHGICCQ
jgi:hypothetical protein